MYAGKIKDWIKMQTLMHPSQIMIKKPIYKDMQYSD